MVSTYTTNIQAEQPARGDQNNTWATNPSNNNSNLYDLVTGGNISISVSTMAGLNVTLLSSQYQCKKITFTGVQAANLQMIFPSSFKKSYEIVHAATNSSLYWIMMYTNQTSGAFIGLPPGETTGIMSDGFDVKYKNLDRVGTFWDYGGSSVPLWVSVCGITGVGPISPPYLNCDGSTFSSSTYPQLADILGGTTLPDSRGRLRATTNQGTARMNAASGGVNGEVNFSAGGSQNMTLTAANIPTLSFSGAFSANCNRTDVVRASCGVQGDNQVNDGVDFQNFLNSVADATQRTASATVTITSCNTGGLSHFNAQPTYVGGLTMIRAG